MSLFTLAHLINVLERKTLPGPVVKPLSLPDRDKSFSITTNISLSLFESNVKGADDESGINTINGKPLNMQIGMRGFVVVVLMKRKTRTKYGK